MTDGLVYLVILLSVAYLIASLMLALSMTKEYGNKYHRNNAMKAGDYATVGFFLVSAPILLPVFVVGWSLTKLANLTDRIS